MLLTDRALRHPRTGVRYGGLLTVLGVLLVGCLAVSAAGRQAPAPLDPRALLLQPAQAPGLRSVVAGWNGLGGDGLYPLAEALGRDFIRPDDQRRAFVAEYASLVDGGGPRRIVSLAVVLPNTRAAHRLLVRTRDVEGFVLGLASRPFKSAPAPVGAAEARLWSSKRDGCAGMAQRATVCPDRSRRRCPAHAPCATLRLTARRASLPRSRPESRRRRARDLLVAATELRCPRRHLSPRSPLRLRTGAHRPSHVPSRGRSRRLASATCASHRPAASTDSRSRSGSTFRGYRAGAGSGGSTCTP